MNPLKRAFSKKEITLILLLTLGLLVLLYYRVVYLQIQDQLSQYDTADLEANIEIEQARAQQIQSMKAAIKEGKSGDNVSRLETYDSQKRRSIC